jgi:hypothetical protein
MGKGAPSGRVVSARFARFLQKQHENCASDDNLLFPLSLACSH